MSDGVFGRVWFVEWQTPSSPKWAPLVFKYFKKDAARYVSWKKEADLSSGLPKGHNHYRIRPWVPQQ